MTIAPSLDALPAPETPSCPTSVARIASATEKEAEALGELAQTLWGSTEAPDLLARAGKLVASRKSGGFCPGTLAGGERDAGRVRLQGEAARDEVDDGSAAGSSVRVGGRRYAPLG